VGNFARFLTPRLEVNIPDADFFQSEELVIQPGYPTLVLYRVPLPETLTAGAHSIETGLTFDNGYFMERSTSFEILPSKEWSDDAWYLDQEERVFIPNDGPKIIREGEAEGTSIGGNLCTFQLLHGTEYMPLLEDTIIFLEDDALTGELFPNSFDRDLQSLIHQPGFEGVKGIIVGRAQKRANMTTEKLRYIIGTKEELAHMPVISDVDFGHTTPQITLPIGGRISMRAMDGRVSIDVLKF